LFEAAAAHPRGGSPFDLMARAFRVAAPLSRRMAARRLCQRALTALAVTAALVPMGFVVGGGFFTVHSRAFAGAGAEPSLVQRLAVPHLQIRHASGNFDSASSELQTAYGEERATDQDWESMHEQAVGFGKYADMTYRELYEEDPDYINWLRSESVDGSSNPKVMELIGYADYLDPPPNPESMKDQLVGFGKYAKMTYKELYEEDPTYIKWLRRQSVDGPPSPKAMGLIGYADYLDGSLTPQERLTRIGRQSVGFGKHKNLTIEKLYEDDYDYIQWLCAQESPSMQVYEIIDYAALRKEICDA